MPVVENKIYAEAQAKLSKFNRSENFFKVSTELYNYAVPYATEYVVENGDNYAIFYSKEELEAVAVEFKFLYMFLHKEEYLDIFTLQGADTEHSTERRKKYSNSVEHIHFYFDYENSFYKDFQEYIEREEKDILELWQRSLIYDEDTFFSVFTFHKQNGHITGLSAPEDSFLFYALQKADPLNYKAKVNALNQKGGIPLPVFKDTFTFLKNEIKELLEKNGIKASIENIITFHILSTSSFFKNVFGNSFKDESLLGDIELNSGTSYTKAMKNGVTIDHLITFNEMGYTFNSLEDYITVMELKTQMPYDSWIDAIGYIVHSRKPNISDFY
jgi:hypothetical protein